MSKYGLTTEEAERSAAEHGTNALSEGERESFAKKLLANLGDPMVKILICALVVNVIFVLMGKTQWYEPVGIAIAIVLAVFVSTYSEYSNENAFRTLQEEASKIFCKVYRNGEIILLPIDALVRGDAVLLQSGDKVPADGRLLEGELSVDQSALNGEAAEAKKLPVSPDAEISPETDFLDPFKIFRGSVVTGGNAVMEVEVVGDASVYGSLAAELAKDEERDSPLKVKLSDLAKKISRLGYIMGIAIACALIFKAFFMENAFDPALIAQYFAVPGNVAKDILDAIMMAVIIIVMSVPEGLPLMIAIVSSLNMSKMLRDNVLVRRINGIETAGSLNILFTDKTGTITRGELSVIRFVDGETNEYESLSELSEGLKIVLTQSIISNSDSVYSKNGDELQIIGGNATERALAAFAAEQSELSPLKTVARIPFTSDNKYSAATVSAEDGGETLTLIKGAPERILERCAYYYAENGKRFILKPEVLSDLERLVNRFAKRSIRVLALATADEPLENDALPSHSRWALVGLMGIRDDVRPEAASAIAEAQNAGVQVVMITGDRKDTAGAIAKEAGVLRSEDEIVLTSGELAALSDDEICSILPRLRVVARALPSDKSRLVRLAQSMGLVAGMTGDGVNDAPSLKAADVGFAMGGGTEVAKEAGDIVILDDNFKSIERAILYGRTIFNSIRKFVVFQLTVNVLAVLISFLSPLLGFAAPLSITQILWVNLVMDTLAALAFGGEPPLQRFMRERPKSRTESIVTKNMLSQILTGSLWALAVSLFFLLGRDIHGVFRPAADDRYLLTGYFCLFIFFAVFNAFNARTSGLDLKEGMSENKGFIKIICLICIVQVAMTYLGGAVLRCYGLTAPEWGFVLILAVTIIPVDLLRKKIMLGKAEKEAAFALPLPAEEVSEEIIEEAPEKEISEEETAEEIPEEETPEEETAEEIPEEEISEEE
ncbi:MAG: calcium-translocating P-type ATPase, PMCA-type, partial [Firmicutes bacterium]|nr:calcium-translocating P-type ATPase, PMCA-type [Bacillota bacterium]